MKDETEINNASKDGKITASMLDAFELLRSPKEDLKLIGGTKVLTQLRGDETEKNIKYVLKRLVRSLGANLPEIRTGYFATLVSLLSKFDQITVSELLGLVKTELHANGSSKSEVGDVALGQILVCSAAFRSGLILRCSEDEQKQLLELLLNASKKKSYLSTVSYLILLDFVNGLDEDQFSTIIWPHLKPECKKDVKDHNLDSLLFLLRVNTKFPQKVKLRKLIGVPEILCEDSLQDVCEKMMAGIDYNSVNHPIYKEIGTQIANSPHLLTFWTTIDSQLVKHNRNRELVALNTITTILNNMKGNFEKIPELLSRNFFKLFMDWFKGLQTASKIRNKKDDEDDHKIMIKKQKEMLNVLAKALKHENVNSEIRVQVLTKLLFNPGEMNFTDITGTTIVKSIISDLDHGGVKKMGKLLKGVLLNISKKTIKEGAERGWYNNERVKAAELISYLVSHEVMKDNTDFKLTYMKLLMCFGFFKIGGDNVVAVSGDLSGAIKTCFYRCFTSRFSNVDNLVTVLSSLCDFICGILKKEEVRTKIEKQFSTENMECWEMLTEICDTIQKNQSKSKVDNVFLILLYQLGLFLFSEPTHVKMARSSVKELKSCHEHYRKTKKKKIKKDASLSEEPEWIEVLVEVLLSILSIESSVLRSVVQCVFRLLWEYLTPSSIGQIVSVIDPESESNPLTNNGGSDDESDKSGEENESEADEKEGEIGEESSEYESDSNIEDDDVNDSEMKIPDQLRMAVQKALGTAAESDNESVDVDMIDDEEAQKLDEALAEAFKQFHQGKGKKIKKDRKDKKALSDFRIRVLDLIDIYLEKDPSMDICLGMIAPLTRCLEFCLADNQFAELGNRIRKTIKNLTKIKKFASTDDVTVEILSDYLKATIDKGGRSHFMFQAIGDVITHFATFIIHCSQKIENKSVKSSKKGKGSSPLLDILKEALHSYFHNRNCLLPIIFFHNVLQMEWESNYDLVPIVIENVFNDNVRQFRRNEGLELIAGFYRALKRTKPTSDVLLAKLSSIETNFEGILTQSLKNVNFEVKNNFFIVLKKLIKTMQIFHESSHVESVINFKALVEIIGSSKGTVKIISNKSQVTETLNQIGKNKKNKKKKHKLELVNGHSEPKLKKMKKDDGSASE